MAGAAEVAALAAAWLGWRAWPQLRGCVRVSMRRRAFPLGEQRDAGGRTRIGEFEAVRGQRGDDPLLLGAANDIRIGAADELHHHRVLGLIDSVSPVIADRPLDDRPGFLSRRLRA